MIQSLVSFSTPDLSITLTLPGPSAGVSGSLDSYCSLKGRIVQATVCCKVGAAALVHLRPVLGGCTILPFKTLMLGHGGK